MNVIICGSRGYSDDIWMPKLEEAIALSGFRITRVIHGANEQSIDRLARLWALKHGIPQDPYPIDYKALKAKFIPPEAGGQIRNQEMGKVGEAVIAIWDGKSSGTKGMISIMERKNRPGFVYRLDGAPHRKFPAQLSFF